MKKLIILIIIIGMCVSVWGADSLRTRSELETLFADNVAGNISAQDLRDFLKSTPVQGRYLAKITTVGTNPPQEAIAYENTIADTVTWSRLSAGKYRVVFSETGITANNILAFATFLGNYYFITIDGAPGLLDNVDFMVYDIAGDSLIDTQGKHFYIEVLYCP